MIYLVQWQVQVMQVVGNWINLIVGVTGNYQSNDTSTNLFGSSME